jgi:transketolase
MNAWGKAHPDKAFNCGVAEANMIGIACGLASAGFKPIVHTFGPFASRRCFDQVFLSGGYAANDITVIGSDPGVCATFNGGTHMPFEDVALYRTIPNAIIFEIVDVPMLESALRQSADLPGIKYIRVGRKESVKFYEPGSVFPAGKAVEIRPGSDAVIFASGIMLDEAMKAAAMLDGDGVRAAVVDIVTVKPLDAGAVAAYARKTGAVVTAENHNRIGGLYGAVCEALSATVPTPVECVAVEDEFGEVGPQDYLQERFGLTAKNIAAKVRAAIARK